MQQELVSRLHSYIIENNSELLIALQSESKVTAYLKDKVTSVQSLLDQATRIGEPEYITLERSMDELTADLRPSRYQYLYELVEEEFPYDFERWKESRVLTYELINLISVCEPVFRARGFSQETWENKKLYYTIIGTASEYIEQQAATETL